MRSSLDEDPTYEVLQRWTKRFPQYRDELARFFATWGIQAVMPQTAQIDQEKLVRQGGDYGLDLARKQGRIIDGPPVESLSLSPFDPMALAAVFSFHGQAYSVNISERVSAMSGTRVLLGVTNFSLSRLEDWGLV